MAINHVTAVIDRLQTDTGFVARYRQNPDGALSIYSLDSEELRALKTGDGLAFELQGIGDKWNAFVETLCGPCPGP